jgi:hypothetical protein
LRVNHFGITLPRDGCIYHYDVTITPSSCPKWINGEVIRAIEEEHHQALVGCKLAFDGMKSLYTSRPLPSINGTPKEFEVTISLEGPSQFKVAIKYVNSIPLDVLSCQLQRVTNANLDSLMTATQAIDVVLRTLPTMRLVEIEISPA